MEIWDKILRLINNMKIRKKLIGVYIIVVLIPVIIVSIYLTISMRNMVMDRAMEEASKNTDRIQDRLNEVLKIATDVSDRLYFDKGLSNIVLKNYKEDRYAVVNAYNNYQIFDEYLRYYKELQSIRLHVQNETMLDNSQFILSTQEVENTDWHKQAIKSDGRVVWQYVYDNNDKRKYLSLTRLIKMGTAKDWCVLVININDKYLNSIIVDEPFETIGAIDDGKIVMSLNNKIKEKKVSSFGINSSLQNIKQDKQKITYNEKPSIIISNTFLPNRTSNKFQVYSVVPIDEIVNKANVASLNVFIIIMLSLVISITLILFLTKILSERIILLRGEMHKVVMGDFNINKNFEGTDEIGELHSDLTIMIESIKLLIHEVYEEKLQKEQLRSRQKEVKFKMLASQINPHFLYNTLETIRMKAHCNGQSEIANIVKILAKLMRRNLEVTNKLVSLESEIELMKNYLIIQKFRFGDRVNFEINILCDIKKYAVIPLLFQPIVENAFVHGLEDKEGAGNLIINLEKIQDYLLISVIDNGVGIEKTKLKAITCGLNNFNDEDKHSIGLCNVNQRIKLLYGEDYGLEIESEVNDGTKVSIKLPIDEEGIVSAQGVVS